MFNRGFKYQKATPLLDLVWGKYISYHGHTDSSLSQHIVVFAKPANKLGEPERIVDVPKDALRYIPPVDPNMPSAGVFVLMAGPAGKGPVGRELEVVSSEVFERIAEAQKKVEIAEAKVKVTDKMALRTQEEHIKDVVEVQKKMKEATSSSMDWMYGPKKPQRTLT